MKQCVDAKRKIEKNDINSEFKKYGKGMTQKCLKRN